MNAQRKMTPKGQMSSSGMGPAIHHLPMHIRALFEANAPLTHLPQLTKRKMPPYSGISDFISQFEKDPPPHRLLSETPKERKERLRAQQIAKHQEKLNQEIAKWDPAVQDDRKTEDAYKTLFVGRISYETTEKQLRHEFEQFGAIKHIRLVEDEEGKSRGYAFIEYEHEADLKAAYKFADGKKIDGRRVVVDVERGRTVHEWRPRKFGGGIGETRKGGPDVNVKYSGREPIGEIRFESYHGGGDQGYAPSRHDSRYGESHHRTRSRERPREHMRRDRRRSRSRSQSRSRDRRQGRDRDRGSDQDRYGYRDTRSTRSRERRVL